MHIDAHGTAHRYDSGMTATEASYIDLRVVVDSAPAYGRDETVASTLIDLLREESSEPMAQSAIEHMQGDLERLERVARRFERIGRPPEQEMVDLAAIVERVAAYFDARVPSLAHAVTIRRQFDPASLPVRGDSVLLEWAVEALIKKGALTRDPNKARSLAIADGIAVPDFNFAGSLSAHKFNYRASVEYKLGDNMLAYLSDATGFRSGGFNGSSTDLDGIVSGQFGPEDTNTAELGFKGEFLENRLRLNVDYFLAKYKHLQQAITDPNNGAISTTNADAKVHGLEAEASAVLTDRWQASLTLSNTHQKIDGTSAVLKQNPEWMWRVGTFYSVPAQPIHGQLRLGAYANYSGSYFQDSGNDPLLRTHAYYVWGASIGYEHEGKHWSALLQGLNLGDQVYPVGGFNIFNGVISSVWYPSFPRRWHLGVQYRF